MLPSPPPQGHTQGHIPETVLGKGHGHVTETTVGYRPKAERDPTRGISVGRHRTGEDYHRNGADYLKIEADYLRIEVDYLRIEVDFLKTGVDYQMIIGDILIHERIVVYHSKVVRGQGHGSVVGRRNHQLFVL